MSRELNTNPPTHPQFNAAAHLRCGLVDWARMFSMHHIISIILKLLRAFVEMKKSPSLIRSANM